MSDVECVFFFFFQAEDGIRDWSVTGVQTCALPIRAVYRLFGSTSCELLSGDFLRLCIAGNPIHNGYTAQRGTAGSPRKIRYGASTFLSGDRRRTCQWIRVLDDHRRPQKTSNMLLASGSRCLRHDLPISRQDRIH